MRTERRVANRFEIEEEAGSGGVGIVYRARDLVTGDAVALKLLRGASDKSGRFSREAEVLAAVSHPAIVRYVAHGATDDGSPWLAMEWLDGLTLADHLKQTGLTADESLALASRVADGLGELHARGFVHRDVKPTNLFLVDGDVGRVKILDFGIVRWLDGEAFTLAGAVLGTPAFMAPEQARGAEQIDARADVFALGCVLYECLTGKRAFHGADSLAVLTKIILEDAPRVRTQRPDLGADIDELVARLLAKQPAQRPRDGRAVVEALRDLTGSGRAPRSTSNAPPALTSAEKKLLNLVLARAPAGAPAPVVSPSLEGLIASLGGRLERLVDGALLVTETTGGLAADQAARAARCALALARTFPGLALVVLTAWTVDPERAPLGDAIDRSVALLDGVVADPSAGGVGIRLDQATAGLLGPRFEIRGDAFGLVLRGERDVTETRRTLLGNERAFVGRAHELELLLSCVRDCFEDRSAAVALVTGPAGIGKSRLRDELLRRIVRELAAVQVWVGQGDAVTAGSPLSLLSRAVCRAMGIADGEPVHVRRQKLRARVERHPLGADSEHAVAFLGELVGVEPAELQPEVRAARHDPQLMTDQIRRALIGWLAAECRATPVVLVLEDLQWGDAPTARLVDAALAELGDLPFMVLASARPEVHQVFPALWSERGATEIRLSALPRRASEQLVREVLGDRAAPAVVARIVDLSSGNALYLEELIRAAADGRDDVPPDSVVAMVQARLGRLPDDARHALRAASVFGDTFWRAGVAKLLGGVRRATGLADSLAELEAAEMISRAPDSRFPGEDEYTFRHRLGREAAHATLAPADRTLGHRLAGEWLEDSGECDALTLAFHFELGDQSDKAASWFASAAEQALERNDFASAVARTERGEACGAEGAVLGRLLRTRAEALGWLGQHADAYRTARAAVDILAPATPAACEALGDLTAAAGRLGKYDELEAIGQTLQDLPSTGDHASAALAALIRCAGNLALAGRYAAADRLLAHVGEIPDDVFDLDPLSGARLSVARGLRATGDGDPSAHLRWIGAAVDAYASLGDLRQANAQRINVAAGLVQLGDYAGARELCEAVVAAATRLGSAPIKASALQNLGLARALDGDLDGGLADLREAVALFEVQGHVRQLSFSLVYLAQVHLLRREVGDARAAAARALETSPKGSPVGCVALGAAARIELAAGAPERALELVGAAMTILDGMGALEEGEFDVRLAFAEILFATGDHAGARRAAGLARERILAKAARITDRRLATWFVERVPANVRLLALAKLWLGDAPG